MLKNLKIRTKLIAGFLVIVISVGIIGYFIIDTSRRLLKESIGEELVLLTEDILDKIDRSVNARIEQIRAYTKDLTLIDYLMQSNKEFSQLPNARAYVDKKDREWIAEPEKTITPFMRSLIENEVSGEIRASVELKPFYKNAYGYAIFDEVFVTNKYGANVAQTQKTTDYFQADEVWWQEAKATGSHVGSVEYDKSTKTWAVDIAQRIEDNDGRFLGVLKAVLNIQEIIDIIKDHETKQARGDNKYTGTRLKLLTEDGRIVYSTERFTMFEHLPDELLTIMENENHKEYWTGGGDKPGEKEQLFSHAHSKGYKNYESKRWSLLMEKNKDEIFIPVTNLRNVLAVAIISLMGFSILVGLVMAQNISGSITKLKNATVEIGKGSLDKKIDIESGDEIGDLARFFNKMSDNLKKSDETEKKAIIAERHKAGELEKLKNALESLVRERTKELSQRVEELERYYDATIGRELRMKELRNQIKKLKDELKEKA